MKMMITTAFAALAYLVPSASFAFVSGDKIRCEDDVSGYVYTIKIEDLGDYEAYVRVDMGQAGTAFLPSDRVIYRESESSAIFHLMENGVNYESIELSSDIKDFGSGEGLFLDGGDSRPMYCKLIK